MKRTFKCALVLFLTILLFASCATQIWKPEQRDYTDEEAAFAMKDVMKEAHRSALSAFYKYLQSNEDFVPSSFNCLLDSENSVVGLSTLLNSWKLYVAQSALDSITNLTPTVDQWLDTLIFDNPRDYVTRSNTSGTELFESLYKQQVKNLVKDELSKLDYSLLDRAISYYNSALKIKNFNIENVELLPNVSIDDINNLADSITEKYFETFASSEEMYRTTPNAYADSVVSLVFGLI